MTESLYWGRGWAWFLIICLQRESSSTEIRICLLTIQARLGTFSWTFIELSLSPDSSLTMWVGSFGLSESTSAVYFSHGHNMFTSGKLWEDLKWAGTSARFWHEHWEMKTVQSRNGPAPQIPFLHAGQNVSYVSLSSLPLLYAVMPK